MQQPSAGSVANDRLPTRRSLHSIPDGSISSAKDEAAPATQTRRTLHSSTRETARDIAEPAPQASTRAARRLTTETPPATPATPEAFPTRRSVTPQPSTRSATPQSAESAPGHKFQTIRPTRPRIETTFTSTDNAQQGTTTATRRSADLSPPSHTPAEATRIVPAYTRQATPPREASPESTNVFNVEDYGPFSPESADLTSIQAAMPLDLRDPTIPEIMWLEEMRYHLKSPQDPQLTPEQLSKLYDQYCQAWHGHSRRHKWDHKFVVTSIGITLGDILVSLSDHNTWVVSENNGSNTYVVRDKKHCATYFPIDAVTRRWVAGKLEWIPGFIENARQHKDEPTTDTQEKE
ncbi:DUF3806 domain-containing protein [Timonella sp. A28]|uniref:DUF3806 domain-containing protein n=1 Tax=Timonella sp. A28 TaxID=3442640 RepID=UPI003EB6B064